MEPPPPDDGPTRSICHCRNASLLASSCRCFRAQLLPRRRAFIDVHRYSCEITGGSSVDDDGGIVEIPPEKLSTIVDHAIRRCSRASREQSRATCSSPLDIDDYAVSGYDVRDMFRIMKRETTLRRGRFGRLVAAVENNVNSRKVELTAIEFATSPICVNFPIHR